MRHVEKDLLEMVKNKTTDEPITKYIRIKNADDIKGVAPTVSFTLQSDPVGEVGVNGCQASDMLEFVKELFKSLNSAVPNKQTEMTISACEEAIHYQYERLRDLKGAKLKGQWKSDWLYT
jgi:hypothetical protein